MSDKIGFIGYGKMADAIGVALHESLSDQYSMIATEPNSERQAWIKSDRQFVDLLSLDALVHQSSVIFLAIKPQQLSELASELSVSFQPNQLIISMLAGVSVGECQRLLNHSNIIRIMPNMPAILKQGVTGMYIPAEVATGFGDLAQQLLVSFGRVIPVQSEDHLNVITAISGSGPAFFYRMVQAFVDFAKGAGLDEFFSA